MHLVPERSQGFESPWVNVWKKDWIAVIFSDFRLESI